MTLVVGVAVTAFLTGYLMSYVAHIEKIKAGSISIRKGSL